MKFAPKHGKIYLENTLWKDLKDQQLQIWSYFIKYSKKKNQFGKLSQSTKTTQTDTGKIKGLR